MTFRFLGAAAVALAEHADAEAVAAALPTPPPLAARPPTNAEVRRWAVDQGYPVSDRGRLSVEIHNAYHHAHSTDANEFAQRATDR